MLDPQTDTAFAGDPDDLPPGWRAAPVRGYPGGVDEDGFEFAGAVRIYDDTGRLVAATCLRCWTLTSREWLRSDAKRPGGVRLECSLCRAGDYTPRPRRPRPPRPACSQDGCDEPRKAWGLCNKHYLRAKRAQNAPQEPQIVPRTPRAITP